MADNNITVDELAIKVAANATEASTSIDKLTLSLTGLATALAPVMGTLGKVTELLRASKGSSMALSAAMKMTSSSVKDTAKAAEMSREKLATLMGTFDQMKTDFAGGVTGGNASLKQMASVVGKVNSEIVKLKLAGSDLIPQSEFMMLDAEFENMIRDVQRLKGAMTDVSQPRVRAIKPMIAQATAPLATITRVSPNPADIFGRVPFTSLTAQQNALAAATTRIGTTAVTTKSKIGGLISNLGGLGKQSKQTQTLMDMLGGSFIKLRSTVFFAMFALATVGAGLGYLMKSAMGYVEQLNLFNVAFADGAKAANQYVDALTTKMGFDPQAFRTMYSMFYLMADSLGVASSAAITLAKDFTQLSYDYASLFDMSIADVQAKFASALSGQSRAVKSLGLDVTKAAQQHQMLKQGIKGSWSELRASDKAILVHNIIMGASVKAQGDFARTLPSPANLLRITGDQFAILARTIGYLFIPAIQATLPWLIALAQALSTVIGSFLGVLGIKMPTWKDMVTAGSGATKLAGGMDNVAKGAGKAAKAAKELLDYTLGIDELNILKPQTNSGGSGGGGAGGGAGGIDIPIAAPYDMTAGLLSAVDKITAPIKAMFKKAADAIRPFLDAIGRLWDALVPFAKNIWRGFTNFWKNVLVPLGVWTLNEAGVKALDTLRGIIEWFNQHPKAAEGIGAALASLTAIKGLGLFLSMISKVGAVLSAVFGLHLIGGIAANIATFLGLFPEAGGVVGAFFAAIGSGESVFGTLAKLLSGVFPSAASIATGAIAGVSGAFSGLTALIGTVAGALGVSFGAAVALVVAAIAVVETVIAGIVVFIVKNWNDIAAFTKRVFMTVWSIIVGIFNIIKTVVLVVVAMIVTTVIKLWERLPGPVKDALTRLWTTITGMFGKIRDSVRGIWDGLQDGLGAVWGVIKNLFRFGANSVIRVLNGIIDAVNKALDMAKSIDLSGILKDVPHIAHIQLMAAETETTHGLAMARGGMPPVGSMFVAGEAGPELMGSFGGSNNTVMPLENSGFVEAMAAATYKAVASAMAGNGDGGTGDVFMDGQKVGKVLRQSDQRLGVSSGLVKVT